MDPSSPAGQPLSSELLVFLQLYVNSYLHLYLFMHTCTCVFTLELAIFLVRYM